MRPGWPWLGALLALWVAAPWRLVTDPASFARMEIFTGMLVYDGFTVFMRGVLLLFLVLFIVFTKLSGVPDREDGPDVYVLVLGATLGFLPDGRGQSPADGVPGGGDGQRAVVRLGRPAQGAID